MRSLKSYVAVILCLVITALTFTACGSDLDLMQKKTETTKEAFDEDEYARTYTDSSAKETVSFATEPGETETSAVTDTTVSDTTASQAAATTAATPASETKATAATKATGTTTTEKTVVDKKNETKETKSNYKYGVVKIDVVTTYYNIYSDGSKVQVDQKKYTKYDSSKYKASTDDLLSEAKSNKTTYSSQINDVLSAVNSYRKSNGKSELTLDSDLCTAAAVRATEMAYSGNTSASKRPDGSDYYSVLTDLDIEYTAAINLTGKGYTSGSDAAAAWKSKSGSTLTSSDYKKAGIGVAAAPDGTLYWCIFFTN